MSSFISHNEFRIGKIQSAWKVLVDVDKSKFVLILGTSYFEKGKEFHVKRKFLQCTFGKGVQNFYKDKYWLPLIPLPLYHYVGYHGRDCNDESVLKNEVKIIIDLKKKQNNINKVAYNLVRKWELCLNDCIHSDLPMYWNGNVNLNTTVAIKPLFK
jgi:hypothetical protein